MGFSEEEVVEAASFHGTLGLFSIYFVIYNDIYIIITCIICIMGFSEEEVVEAASFHGTLGLFLYIYNHNNIIILYI